MQVMELPGAREAVGGQVTDVLSSSTANGATNVTLPVFVRT